MEYKELRQIDVSKYTEKKNGLTYLSWAWAVDQLLLADPKAHWFYPEFQRWGNGSVMVFCTVVANDIARTAQLPVMDYRNKPIAEPDSFAVNTAMQRCLAKAIALHGIGLYIYNGEDVPPDLGEDVTANVETKQAPKVAAPPKTSPAPVKAPKKGAEFDYLLTPVGEQGSKEWIEGVKVGAKTALALADKADDVANIFKNNRSIFDALKVADEPAYAELMTQFSTTKKALTKE
jgi:Protein of unknown function (DUF1071)